MLKRRITTAVVRRALFLLMSCVFAALLASVCSPACAETTATTVNGTLITDADVDDAFAQMCAHMRTTPEQLTKTLEGQGVRVDTLKRRIKADLARGALAHPRR